MRTSRPTFPALALAALTYGFAGTARAQGPVTSDVISLGSARDLAGCTSEGVETLSALGIEIFERTDTSLSGGLRDTLVRIDCVAQASRVDILAFVAGPPAAVREMTAALADPPRLTIQWSSRTMVAGTVTSRVLADCPALLVRAMSALSYDSTPRGAAVIASVDDRTVVGARCIPTDRTTQQIVLTVAVRAASDRAVETVMASVVRALTAAGMTPTPTAIAPRAPPPSR